MARGPLLGDWLGIGWLVVNNCFHLHPLSFLRFYFSLFLIFLFITFFVIIILFQLLNCFYLNPRVSLHLPFSFSPPSHTIQYALMNHHSPSQPLL